MFVKMLMRCGECFFLLKLARLLLFDFVLGGKEFQLFVGLFVC